MPSIDLLFNLLGYLVVGAPALLVLLLGGASLLGRPLGERAVGRLVPACILVGLSASLAVLGLMLSLDRLIVTIRVGDWVSVPHYHFQIKFVFDRLSVPFVILAFVLCGTIGAFANRYMHREPGFNRFFVLFALFVQGIVAASLAGTIETLFVGWEMVGLSSALLVAFYQGRAAPVRNGLRVWTVYRVSDAALLLASVVLHHRSGDGDFAKILGAGPWPASQTTLAPPECLMVGLLLLVAAAGKSALVPFSGWLPRAMEGPTPSSAVFYGALSVHLGAFLLLRASPLLDGSPALCVVIVAVGATTAVLAALAGRTQSDIKSALSFASLCQVGIITAEIGLGLRYIALIHLLGHGCLRTLQFIRAPTILLDVSRMENALGERLPHRPANGGARRWSDWFYRFALERGYLDSLLDRFVADPFLALFRRFDAAERKWTDFLAGRRSRESDDVPPATTPFEDLL